MIGSAKENDGTHEPGDMTGSRPPCKAPGAVLIKRRINDREGDKVGCAPAANAYITREISCVRMSV